MAQWLPTDVNFEPGELALADDYAKNFAPRSARYPVVARIRVVSRPRAVRRRWRRQDRAAENRAGFSGFAGLGLGSLPGCSSSCPTSSIDERHPGILTGFGGGIMDADVHHGVGLQLVGNVFFYRRGDQHLLD